MKQLTSVTELPSLYGEGELTGEEPLTWDFNLPGHLDAERIVVDTGHLRRIQKLAGFSANHVISYDGEKPEVQPVIAGVNSDGTALAGFISLAKESIRSRQELVDEYQKDLMINYFDTDIRNELDKSQIISRIVDRRRKYARGSEPTNEHMWAEAIDDHLQLSIRRAARKHLMGRGTKGWKIVEVCNSLGFTGGIIYSSIIGDTVTAAEFAGMFAVQRALLIGHDSAINHAIYGETFIKNRRSFLFMQMQPDRYVALDALTRVNSLVKVKK